MNTGDKICAVCTCIAACLVLWVLGTFITQFFSIFQ